MSTYIASSPTAVFPASSCSRSCISASTHGRERGFAALDVFMCGDCNPYDGIPALKDAFAPENVQLTEHKRGTGSLNWFPEKLHSHVSTHYEVSEILYQGNTGFQDLVIFLNPTFGRIMALDGVIQTTERDEFVYHEMMAHVPLFAHGSAKRVLIIGGGDGGVLREVLKHPVEAVTEVELDAGVVEVSKQHLPAICGKAYDDPRTRLIIGDGAKFLAETDETFDAILVDSTDPIGPGTVLFSREFYANCKRCLTERGTLVTQNGVPFMQSDELTTSVGHFRALFPDAWCYLATVPTYVNGPMALGWASMDAAAREVPRETLRARYAAVRPDTKYYNPEVHLGAFALPNYVRALIDERS